MTSDSYSVIHAATIATVSRGDRTCMVLLPTIDGGRQRHGPVRYLPAGPLTHPMRGQEAVVLEDLDGGMWLASWTVDELDDAQPGPDGRSAYDVWLAAGHTGSVSDYLASLKGDPGRQGDPGPSAYDVWRGAGNTGSVADYLASLKGAQGDPGPAAEAPSVGEIIMHGSTKAPSAKWLLCDGAALARTGTYAALYAAIGTTWGAGNGSTTFTLPDLRGRTAIGTGTGPNLTARTAGAQVGTETHTLVLAQIPSHTHTQSYYVGAQAGGNAAAPGASYFGNETTAAGGGQAHPNMQPSLAVPHYIRALP